MGVYRISDLPLVNRELLLSREPSANLHQLSDVVSLELNFSPPRLPSLRLTVQYIGSRPYLLTLIFRGVSQLALPEIRPVMSLPELEVEDIRDRGLEDCRFEVVSHFERAFRFYCREMELISVSEGVMDDERFR